METVLDIYKREYNPLNPIVCFMDNLNTHTPASLYSCYDPITARRIADKLDIQYTPKHGSWLNMAEIEFSALSRQCLNRRIATQERLIEEVKHGRINEMQQAYDALGVSRQAMRGSNSRSCIQHPSKIILQIFDTEY